MIPQDLYQEIQIGIRFASEDFEAQAERLEEWLYDAPELPDCVAGRMATIASRPSIQDAADALLILVEGELERLGVKNWLEWQADYEGLVEEKPVDTLEHAELSEEERMDIARIVQNPEFRTLMCLRRWLGRVDEDLPSAAESIISLG